MKKTTTILIVGIIFIATCFTSTAQAQDGVYISQPDEAAGIDTILGQKNSNTNFGTWVNLNFGEQDNEIDLGRSLIKFNLPANVTVTSASLCLWHVLDSSSNITTAGVYRMKRPWLEGGATWNTSGAGAWQVAGGFGVADAEQTPIATMTLGADEPVGEKCFSLDVGAIQQMVDGTFANNGFLLKTTNELNDLYRFCSSSCAIANQRPKLTILYNYPLVTPMPYTPPSNSINLNPGNTLVIPIMGQSNASGRGQIVSRSLNSSVLIFGNDYRYRVAIEPSDNSNGQVDLVSADTEAAYGFATELGKLIQSENPDKIIVLVPCAMGSTSIKNWQPAYADDTLYGSCLKRVKAAQGQVIMIAFAQCESDAINYSDAVTWDYYFKNLVNQIRIDYGEMPVVFMQIGEHVNTLSFPFWDIVREHQESIDLPCVAMVSTNGIAMDFPHFYTTGYDEIANRFFSSYQEMQCNN